MIGEQLMDVLGSHQLRQAHLNLIYNRLAPLGADVQPSPEQSCEGMFRLATQRTYAMLPPAWMPQSKVSS